MARALIVIDMQPDFCPGGRLPVAGGDEIVGPINDMMAEFDAVVLTQAMVQRALWVDRLARATWSAWRSTPHLAWTVEEALAQARELAGPEDCICVTGSVFVVAAAMQALGMEVR